jgi:hypothetical protein
MDLISKIITCRLCGHEAYFCFSGTLLRTYEVGYFRCSECHSLETAEPYWLGQAYRRHLTAQDVGAVQRSILNSIVCAYVLEAVGISSRESCLDWGGGDGLFTRMMRDRGFNFLSYDKYADPIYIQTFSAAATEKLSPAVITAFEVFEHLPHPHDDLECLFSLNPALLVFTTLLYQGQGSDWWYLAPEGGQHVFFYSRKALQSIGARFGYEFIELPEVLLFVSEQRLRLATGSVRQKKPWGAGFVAALREAKRRGRQCWRVARGQSHFQGLQNLMHHREKTFDIAVDRFVRHIHDPWRYISVDFDSVRRQMKGNIASISLGDDTTLMTAPPHILAPSPSMRKASHAG